MAWPRLRALVSAGATTDAICDVRIVRSCSVVGGESLKELQYFEFTNIFNGKFGFSIAKALRDQGVDVTLVGSKAAFERQQVPNGVETYSFVTYEDLARNLKREMTCTELDLVFMSAAVADYSPRKVKGKIPSDKPKLTIELWPNAKLIDSFREWAGRAATLVGFKVLSGVSDQTMGEYQTRQLARAQSDFCVGNDLASCDFENDVRRLRVQAADGQVWRVSGSAEESAKELVSLVLKQRKQSQGS